ncbi:ectonucleoside triphosphate diphosphohydrolase 2-like isoform X1 [Micropterus dolomieu]|uniref:ectonucleoside triphosphate diphosphohydrolase 2-like isoform X1 n=1 Tax=Micropterus dolomieu TaxID=147949 RepID=UPI001E8D3254|nr:ectonucleoside triphosphate diphosphohydrolase 2-like isoform X1 [Micropterus dolomieu]XP_045890701.1 ectonucleoside triphosphate diphosphohydrolase 2-like isoform X1 [Micropterus dolomieu]
MGLRYALTIPAVVLLILAIVGILLVVLPTKEIEMPPENMYGIVLDAGSSHTSMYIYKWPADKLNGTGIVTQHSECHAEGGGISSYAGVPGGAAKSLEACLEQAAKDIPKFRHQQTPLYLGCTAGMRLLNIVNATESQQVLKEVKNKLQSYPFDFKEATILSGQEEGAYGWVTVNYLLENFVKCGFVGRWLNPGRETIGALDLGGASTQITFETSEEVEDKQNVMALELYGKNYKIYTQSFLCYGQDQFLKKLLAHLIMPEVVKPELNHPCYPQQFKTSIKLGEDVFDSPCTKKYRPAQFDRQMSISVVGTGNYQKCLDDIKNMFSFDNCSYSECSFDGVFQPTVRGSFMAFSAFFFTHSYINRLTNIPITSPSRLEEAIRLICNMTISEMTEKTNQSEKYMKNVCAVSNFVQVILTKGYGFNEHSFPSISFQKKAGGASVGWALGYMLSQSNIVQAESLGLMKALPSGPWTGILFLFITLLLIAVGYLIMIYRTRNREAMV